MTFLGPPRTLGPQNPLKKSLVKIEQIREILGKPRRILGESYRDPGGAWRPLQPLGSVDGRSSAAAGGLSTSRPRLETLPARGDIAAMQSMEVPRISLFLLGFPMIS